MLAPVTRVEDGHHAIQQAAAFLHRDDGPSNVGIDLGDRPHFLQLVRHTGFNR